MNPYEYDELCRLLRERSGLDLSAGKQYLVDSRLQPVVDRAGLAGLGALMQRLKAPNAEGLKAEVVEAMTTKETFFFPRQGSIREFLQSDDAGAHDGTGGPAADSDLVCGRSDRTGTLFARHRARRDGREG